MPRRALRPSFVVTFALGASAIAGGCSSQDSSHGNSSIGDGSIGDGSIGDGSIGDDSIGYGGWCPDAELPTLGAPCDVSPSVQCTYTVPCFSSGQTSWWVCQQGTWEQVQATPCNPPSPVYEAGPDVNDAAPDVADAGPDVLDGGHD